MNQYLPPPPNTGATPPGYVPYGATGAGGWPMAARAQPLQGLALALTILLAIAALFAVGVAFVHFDRASLIDDTFGSAGGIDFSAMQELDDADGRVGGFTGLYLLMVLITGVVFIVWQFRHAKNAEALGSRGGLGPGWAIGGWFVPLGSFVLPGLQLHQASRPSDPAPLPGRPGRGRPIVIAWMVAWALSGLLLTIGSVMEPSENDVFTDLDQIVDDQTSADRTSAVGALLAAVAGGLAIAMVRQLTRLQMQASDRHRATITNAPPPPTTPPPIWSPPPPPSGHAAASTTAGRSTAAARGFEAADLKAGGGVGAEAPPEPPPREGWLRHPRATSSQRRPKAVTAQLRGARRRRATRIDHPQATFPSSTGFTRVGWVGTMRTVMP